MDIGTLIGLLAAFGFAILSIILGSNLMAFVDGPSLLLVVGGSFSAVFIMFPTKVMITTFKVVGKCFLYATDDPRKLVDNIIQLSERARRESIVALEKVYVSNAFLARGVMLVADGAELPMLRAVLDIDISLMQQRHWRGQEVLKQLGTYAPAFGMMGTLIGLVQMLQNMDDPRKIGPAMAIALLTTFYGTVLANIVWLPLAKKLEERSNDESRNMELMKEGLLAIQRGEHPAMIREKLQSFLPPTLRRERR